MLDGFVADLTGLAGAEEQFFSAGKGDAEGFAALVGDIHSRKGLGEG